MSITGYSFLQLGQFTLATVTSDLGGSPTFFWYIDGAFFQRTDVAELMVYLAADDQADIVAVDTLTPDAFDVQASAPTVFPARRTLWWVRSTDTDVSRYVIRQQRAAEGFVDVGSVPHTSAWSYRFLSPRLSDLFAYQWTITPVDEAGNEGTALTIGPELIVRKPDSPDFTIVFTPGTLRTEFFAA